MCELFEQVRTNVFSHSVSQKAVLYFTSDSKADNSRYWAKSSHALFTVL